MIKPLCKGRLFYAIYMNFAIFVSKNKTHFAGGALARDP